MSSVLSFDFHNGRSHDAYVTPRGCGGNQVNLRDMAYPSRLLCGRMSVGVRSDPTELAATQTAAWPWGPRAGVASGLNYAPDLCLSRDQSLGIGLHKPYN
jgi:hypothetical protein